MCGIAGRFLVDGHVSRTELDHMLGRLIHRGPDGQSLWLNDHLGMVHTRLSIIDPEGGAQPLISEDGRIILVANGEIYNDPELRCMLEAMGARFRTGSDCETILHAYRFLGESFVQYLHGMFAFALYDQSQDRLFIARDRLGIKPLFVRESSEGLSFASQLQVLLPETMEEGTPFFNRKALMEILYTGFSTGSESLVENIERLSPAEMRIYRMGCFERKITYWTPLAIRRRSMSEKEAMDSFNELMQGIMHEHVRSDVPFALFLSGGIDSSLLLAELRREEVGEITAFTARFPDAPQQDDLHAAEYLARQYDLHHHVITLDQQQVFKHLPFVIWAVDDLIVDPAIIPTSLLAQEVARDFKVVFSGEGGDELFAGYGRYRRSGLQRFIANLRSPGSGGFRIRGLAETNAYPALFHDKWPFSLQQARSGLVEAWQKTPAHWTPLQKMQYVDLVTELTDRFLVKADRCLMAWGLEGRVPFLDHRLVEFAFGLSDEIKVRGRMGKYLLKQRAASLFGNDFAYRPKRGFSVPIEGCFTPQVLGNLMDLLPKSPAFEGVLDAEAVRGVVKRQQHNGDRHNLLLALLQWALWHRIFVLGRGERPAPFCDPIDLLA